MSRTSVVSLAIMAVSIADRVAWSGSSRNRHAFHAISWGDYPACMAAQPPLGFDPIERAGALWEEHWPGEPAEVYRAMRAVTSVMRAHQILIAELDAMLRPYGITFSRYEALVLLMFARNGSLPL